MRERRWTTSLRHSRCHSSVTLTLGLMSLPLPRVRHNSHLVHLRYFVGPSKGISLYRFPFFFVLRLCASRRPFTYMLSMLDSIRRYDRSDIELCPRGLRLFGTFIGSNRLDRLLAQQEEWIVVSKKKFARAFPRLLSLHCCYIVRNPITRSFQTRRNVV
jgi:hypothetical protein